MKKRIAAVIMSVIMLAGASAVSAGVTGSGQADKAIWKYLTPYQEAVEGGNNNKIVEAGEALARFLVDDGDFAAGADRFKKNGDTWYIGLLYPALKNVAEAREKRGDSYGELAKAYKNMLPFAKAYKPQANNPADMDYVITSTENKIAKYGVQLTVYAKTDGASPVFHGAKFEPKSGLYYGETQSLTDSRARRNTYLAKLDKTPSGTLVYIHYESEKMDDFDWMFTRLEGEYDIIEVAWNLTGENGTLKQVLKDKSKIESELKYLASLKVNVLLRFGAEMNVWTKLAAPADYIAAFRFVADIAHKTAPNVAMLWSPNALGTDGTTFDMYYPGDEYVDWVGMSLYTSKYFLGDKNQSEQTQATYSTGKYADPIQKARQLIEKYGAVKPIAVSEGGVENYSVKNNEDVSDWAANYMRASYCYLPVVYPEIKAVFYFDNYIKGERARYSIWDNEPMNKLYASLTAAPSFLKKGTPASGFSYSKIGAGKTGVKADSVTLLSFAPVYDLEKVSVTYSINGKTLFAAGAIPYDYTIDMSGYDDGVHTIKAELKQGGKPLAVTNIYAKKSGGSVTLSAGELK